MTTRRAFTLVELLTVIVIISIVGLITLAAYRSIAGGARHSMASNAIGSTLDNARAIAIRSGRRTMVVFRPVLTGPETQQVEVLVAIETGDAHLNEHAEMQVDWGWHTETLLGIRFEPVDGIEPRLLPRDIMVASPVYSMSSTDGGQPQEAWLSLSYLPGMRGLSDDESAGVVLGVLFGKDGSVRTSFSDTGAQLAFVDFNGDGGQRCHGTDYCLLPECRVVEHNAMQSGVPEPGVNFNCVFGQEDSSVPLFYCQSNADDEPYVLVAPFFSIYDYAEARDTYGGEVTWGDPALRMQELNEYVQEHGHAIHFNNYTGVTTK